MAGKFADLDAKCRNTIEHFKKEMKAVRTGRASAGLLEGLTVDYYGAQTPLIQLGMINVPESRLITITVYDRGAVEAVEKAIQQADLGLNPSRDGGLIRIAIPALTEERRKDLVKKVHKMGEEAKVVIRNHRREANDAIKAQLKDKDIAEDDARRGNDEIQKLADKSIIDLDGIVQQKEKEIMEV